MLNATISETVAAPPLLPICSVYCLAEPSGRSQLCVWLCVATFPVKTYCLLLPSFAWEPFYSVFIGWAGGRMGGNYCMHPVMCRNSRKGRMVHSCSINDSATSYLCFLKMKRPLNKEVYRKACVCSVPAPAFYCIFTILQTGDFTGARCLFARWYKTMVVCGLAQTGSGQYPLWKKQSLHFIGLYWTLWKGFNTMILH